MTAQNLLLIFNLFILEGLLSVDNAAVLAVMVKDLPNPKDRTKALRYGLIGAYVLRGACLFIASWLTKAWLLKIAGGLFLCRLAYKHFSKNEHILEQDDQDQGNSTIYTALSKIGLSQFVTTIILVEIMDLTFSVDNIFAAVAMSDEKWVIITGVFMGIAAMRFISGWFVTMLEKYKTLENSAFIVIALLGLKLVLSGISSGVGISVLNEIFAYHYTDMIFSGLLMIIFFFPIIKNNLFPSTSK